MTGKSRTAEQQQTDFWQSVHQPKVGCWDWQRGQNGRGYGRVCFCGKYWRTHRLAWHSAVGEIPSGLFVLHTCDNPACCNPAHLWLGTQLENMGDASAKGRINPWRRGITHCKRGHEFNKKNTYHHKNGLRRCRACNRERERDVYQRAKVD